MDEGERVMVVTASVLNYTAMNVIITDEGLI